MTEDMDSKIASIQTKIEREMRLTRSLVLLCTAGLLGIILYSMTIMYDYVPKLIWSTFQENLQLTHDHWMLLDRNSENKGAAAETEPAGSAK